MRVIADNHRILIEGMIAVLEAHINSCYVEREK